MDSYPNFAGFIFIALALVHPYGAEEEVLEGHFWSSHIDGTFGPGLPFCPGLLFGPGLLWRLPF